MDAVLVSLLTWPTIDVLRRIMGSSPSNDVADFRNQSNLVPDPTLFEYILQWGDFEQVTWMLSSLSPLQIDEVLHVVKGIDNNSNPIIIKQLHHAIKKDNRTDAFEAIMQFLIKQT